MDVTSLQAALSRGNPICLFDFPDREAETDVLFVGHAPSPAGIDFLRRQVGGPLAVYLTDALLDRLGVPTFVDLVASSAHFPELIQLTRPARGHDPRFAVSLDLRTNRTGCSPQEGAATIRALLDLVCEVDRIADSELQRRFLEQFLAPGHIPLIRGAPGLLNERCGHTELSLTLAAGFELPGIIVAGELIDPESLASMDEATARVFAGRHDLPFVTGREILGQWPPTKSTHRPRGRVRRR